jgi:hypothetical protein
MKTIALLAFLCGASDIAFAQALGCQPTPKAGGLFDCYNGIARTPSPSKRAIPKVLAVQAKTPVPEAPAKALADDDDVLIYENKKLDTKVKSLCRGC